MYWIIGVIVGLALMFITALIGKKCVEEFPDEEEDIRPGFTIAIFVMGILGVLAWPFMIPIYILIIGALFISKKFLYPKKDG